MACVDARHGQRAQVDGRVGRLMNPQPMNGIRATLYHDEGAYVQCGYCGRYSLYPATLGDNAPLCDCGERHGWSGSFKRPTIHSMYARSKTPNV